MASNINYLSIDQDFPVPGVDNETQGFRDNFSIIRNSLSAAKTEIEALQTNTAKTNSSNNFSGNDIIDANFIAATQEYFTPGSTVILNSDISFENGHYQNIQVGAAVTLSLKDWPASGRYASIRIALYGDGTGRLVTFAQAGGTIYYDNSFPSRPITVTSGTQPTVIEFWTHTGGSIVYAKYLGTFAP